MADVKAQSDHPEESGSPGEPAPASDASNMHSTAATDIPTPPAADTSPPTVLPTPTSVVMETRHAVVTELRHSELTEMRYAAEMDTSSPDVAKTPSPVVEDIPPPIDTGSKQRRREPRVPPHYKRFAMRIAYTAALVSVISLHLLLACWGIFQLVSESGNEVTSELTTFFKRLDVAGPTFFRQLFITGIFLHGLALALSFFGLLTTQRLRSALGVVMLSTAVSVLLAADQPVMSLGTSSGAGGVNTLWGLMYTLITVHQPLLFLSFLSLGAVVGGIYYVSRALFSIQYEGAGLVIRLRGQKISYVPIYPQVSWQNTKIYVREGEELSIELSGCVSPGALLEVREWKMFMDKEFVEFQRRGNKPEEWKSLKLPASWPFTGPTGYKPEWYRGATKIPIFQKYPQFRDHDDYYKQDSTLTVMGLPHMWVLGMIVAPGDPAPKTAEESIPAYDWEKDEDKAILMNLSSDYYPMTVVAKNTGEFWIVINDVDIARWDNNGLLFLRVTQNPAL